jgi:hypothetical protein
MNENYDLEDGLRSLAEAGPREAGPAVQQELLVRFRERHNRKRRWAYLAGAAACLALAVALSLALSHNRNATQRVSLAAEDQPAGFITLPYGQSGVPLEQPVIVRVDIPVSELGIMGLPLAPRGAKEQVRADLLVGQDGVARAVRFVE